MSGVQATHNLLPRHRLNFARSASHAFGLRRPLRAGIGGSPLALTQTRAVMELLRRARPEQMLSIEVIRTTGGAVQDRGLADIGGKGLFSKEIHQELLDGRIDFAVHSLKDLETEPPPNIVLACALPREDARGAHIRDLLCQISDCRAELAATARRAVLQALDGSCRTTDWRLRALHFRWEPAADRRGRAA